MYVGGLYLHIIDSCIFGYSLGKVKVSSDQKMAHLEQKSLSKKGGRKKYIVKSGADTKRTYKLSKQQ